MTRKNTISLRRAKVELDHAGARYFDLYELAPVGYFSVSESGLIEQANLAAATLLGMDRSKLVKQPLSRFIERQDQDLYYLQRRKLLVSAAAQTFDLRLVKCDGTRFWAELKMSIVRDEALATVLLVVLSDVSVRKLAEQGLEQMATTLEQQLHLHKQQLRKLSMELTMTEERARRLLAEELHDNLGQLLAVIQIRLTVLADSLASTLINPVIALVAQATISARSLIRQLSPPSLHTKGPLAAFEDLAEDLQRTYQLTVQIDAPRPLEPLVAGLHAVLHRSVHELLINVVKHAEVSTARLTIRHQGENLLLMVSDLGCGFDAAKLETNKSEPYGFGLSSIYERISAIGGEMIIDSQPGQGTSVTLKVPYETAPQQPPA